jgi:hypothetical protein
MFDLFNYLTNMIYLILSLMVPAANGISTKYIPPQSVGGGMMSQGGFVQVQNTYHPPQSIGGGMISQGGWAQTEIRPKDPVIQAIIDIAAFTARGKQPQE